MDTVSIAQLTISFYLLAAQNQSDQMTVNRLQSRSYELKKKQDHDNDCKYTEAFDISHKAL